MNDFTQPLICYKSANHYPLTAKKWVRRVHYWCGFTPFAFNPETHKYLNYTSQMMKPQYLVSISLDHHHQFYSTSALFWSSPPSFYGSVLSVPWSLQTALKKLNLCLSYFTTLGQKSSIYPKKLRFENLIFWQNSHFQSLISHKIQVFQTSNPW